MDDEDDEIKDAPVKFINTIFIPFHPIFRTIMLIIVLIKGLAGPLLSVYPVIYCTKDLERNEYYVSLSYLLLLCDVIYGVDLFLHILHRQLTEQAVKRLHPKKSGIKLIMDLISIMPLFNMMGHGEDCPAVQLWPNILLFSYFFVIYRVVEHFSLFETHSTAKLLIGYIMILALLINCISCLILLLTAHGLCENCTDPNNIYDWRLYVIHKFPEVRDNVAYVSAAALSLSFLLDKLVDEIKPATYAGFLIAIAMLIFSYSFAIFIIIPKLFAEYLLRLRRICDFHPRVQRIIAETKRRNPAPSVYDSVEKFYQLMWKKHNGITRMPDVIMELPRYLRFEINYDLVWPVFYHSPILRDTSLPFQRWLGQFISLEYKMPQERFFIGLHCYSSLYYLKSGIAQFISADDAASPTLSITSGTLIGDISFYCPPFRRKVLIHCLTYCEIYTVCRKDIITALHIFPEDRENIIDRVWDKVNHARTLMRQKTQTLPMDRSDQEDIDWLKKRWWQIHDILEANKLLTSGRDINEKIPIEHESYHCPKYIGQLVLCSDMALKKKTLFAKTEFPWILLPNSAFDKVWRRLMLILVCLVLILYPPSIIRKTKPLWFWFFDFGVTCVYFADILVSLMTWPKNVINNNLEFYAILINRFKSRKFIIDLLSTIPFEHVTLITGKREMFFILKFNRLLRIYLLFTKATRREYDRQYDPMDVIFYKLMMVKFCFAYVAAYFLYELHRFLPGQLGTTYLFGSTVCPHYSTGTDCDQDGKGYAHLFIAYMFELVFNEVIAHTRLELLAGMIIRCIAYILMLYIKVKFIASLYLKYRDKTSYHYFVASIKRHFIDHRIHPDLLKRMDRHLICHWKYFHGMDVLTPNILKDEPKDIHWKFQGAIAEKIIGSSKIFSGANRDLIKELGNHAKFLIIPKIASVAIFGVPLRNVTWLVNGQVRCEYFGQNNELIRYYEGSGQVLSLGAVFFGSGSFRTYMAATDCEVITVERKLFFQIIKRYPEDWMHLKHCMDKFGPVYNKIFKEYLTQHGDYKLTLRERVFHSRNSIMQEIDADHMNKRASLYGIPYSIRHDPESRYTMIWMFFRALTAIASIMLITIQGGSGALYKKYLNYGILVCRCLSLTDIIFKLTVLPYYDEKGLVIRSMRKRALHYIGRGFLADVIGTLPMRIVLRSLMSTTLTDNVYFLTEVAASYAHIYLFTGYFNYIVDKPTSKLPYIMIVKWQIYLSLLLLGASAYFTTDCIEFTWTKNGHLAHLERVNGCWAPSFIDLNWEPTYKQLHDIYAQSISLAQCGLTRMNLGMFHLDRNKTGLVVVFVTLSLVYWYIISSCQTLLVLQYRGDTLFSHGISQLRSFLETERLDKEFIEGVIHHFKYWWTRSQGVGIQLTMSERISAILKEDLNFYFYKKTLRALDTILRGGEELQRNLCNVVTTAYFLPDEDIVRAMDVVPWLSIVHRGSVAIIRGEKQVAKITKGCIIGQFENGPMRPLHITARTLEHTDILQVPLKDFQEIIGDEIRQRIERHPNSKNDFMMTRKRYVETAHNTIQYILRGTKTIHPPFIKQPVSLRNFWYNRWLFFSWLVVPAVAVAVSMILPVLPPNPRAQVLYILHIVDFFHILHIITEFYTTELIVKNNECVMVFLGWKKFKSWKFHLDIFSLAIPIVGNIFNAWKTNIVRVLRLRLFCDFYQHFCKDFRSRHTSIVLKAVIIVLLFHGITCGWIYVACRVYEVEDFPRPRHPMPDYINKSIDYGEWVLPEDRRGGCPRLTRCAAMEDGTREVWFVVAKHWYADYILALSFVIVLHTHTNMDNTVELTLSQVYYKIFIDLILYMAEMWISSITVSAVYTKYREMYQYSFSVSNLVMYLNQNGLSHSLLKSVIKYTKMLWIRQKGCWLPEITKQGPLCLQEDILSALYMYHLKTPIVFQILPDYFLRQMAVRLKRIVIFPGKYIVQEGDIFPSIYFIHEGEVEKWYKSDNGECRIMSVLSMNGYFGLVPGLYPDMPFQFSYYSRTVVDLIYLNYYDWQDLLVLYTDIRKKLYKHADSLIGPLLKPRAVAVTATPKAHHGNN